MKNIIAELQFFKEKLYNGIFKNRVGCFDEAIKCIKKLEKGLVLIEEMAEELENCYGRETELTQKARDFINNDLT